MIFGLTIFLLKQTFYPKNIIDPRINLWQKKKIFGTKKIFDPKRILKPKNVFYPKGILNRKYLGSK